MAEYPEKLKEMLADFDFVTTRSERTELLLDIAGRFETVPARIATRPYASEHRVPACESDAYVWSEPQPDGTLKFHFAVENPQGLSAQAMAVILDETLSGAPLEQVAAVTPDIVLRIFGHEISMGKGQGLMEMVRAIQHHARRALAEKTS
jgi:cysteine desulfuration protein SufE